MADPGLDTRIRDELRRIPAPGPDLGRVRRRAHSLRVRRGLTAVLATALIGAGVGGPLWLLTPRGEPPPDRNGSGADPSTGLLATAPEGWDIRVVEAQGYPAVLQAANTALPDARSTDDVTLSGFRFELVAGQVAVIVLDQTEQIIPEDVDAGEARAWRWEDFPSSDGPIALTRDDLALEAGGEGQAVHPDHAFARWQVFLGGRALDLWVDFGASDPPDSLLAEVNKMLATLRVSPQEAQPDPVIIIGPAPAPWETGWPPPTFEPAPGWYLASTGTVDPEAELIPITWAANVPFSQADLAEARIAGSLGFPPAETLRTLDADQIALVALLWSADRRNAPTGPDQNFPTRELPLRLSDADVRSSWEGQVHSDVPEFLLLAWAGGWNLDVRVYFGSQEPSEETLAEAQAQLDRLRLPDPPTPPPPTASYLDADDGLAISIPDSWTFRENPSGPDLPPTQFAVGSWTFPTGGECAPIEAQHVMPPDGALIWLLEPGLGGDLDPEAFPPRPDDFALDESTLGTYECSAVASYMLRFTEAGRYFQAHIAFGADAPEQIRDEAITALDRMEVTAPIPETCPAGFGPWSDPDCPAPVWVDAFVEAAGYRVTGDTGSALIGDAEGEGFHVWAFVPETGRGLEEVLTEEGYTWWRGFGTDVYADGQRVAWLADDLWVYLTGLLGGLPTERVIEDLVRASLAVDYDAIDTRP
jgi:hypothetical protein